jgi:multidrug efflux pump subunit AcrA (membrane-fusion protein)
VAQGIVENSSQGSESSGTAQSAGVPARSQMVQRLLDASSSLPAFIHDLLTTQAVTVVATEAAAFLVEQSGDAQTLRNVAHIRPDNATAEVRAAALEAFQDLVRPCIVQNKEGLIELGNPGEGNEPQFCLVTPLRQDGNVVAVTAVITRCMNMDRAKQRLMQMQLVAGYFDLYTLRRNSDQSRVIAQSHQNVLQLANAVAMSEGFQQACLNLCNELASRTSASRVSLGWVKQQQIKVQALSHTEEFDRKQELVVQIEGAMEECLDQEQMVQFSPEGGGTQNVSRNAQILSRSQGGNAVLSLPLRRRDEIIGVVTLEFLPGTKITPSMAQGLAVAVDLLATQLYDRYVNDRWLITKAGISARETAKLVVGPKHMLAKLVFILCVGALVFVTFYKPMYRVSAPFTFTPIQSRLITMPFEEQLSKVNVKPGQKVKKGDVLAEVRTFNIVNRLKDSQLAAYEARKQSDTFRSKGDFGQASAYGFKYERAMQDVEYYSKQIEEAKVIAPFDGEILKADIEDKLNASFKQGDTLIEMAPEGELQAEIKVSEADITDVYQPKADGTRQVGHIATTSDPRNHRKITIDRVVPMATVDNGANVFKVYGKLEEPDPSWKPGMNGEARIDVEPRPMIYVWTHKLADFVRMKLWL